MQTSIAAYPVSNARRLLPSQGVLPTRPAKRSIAVRAAKEEEVRCYVNEEGHLVCDRLEPGDYVVKGTSPTQEGQAAAEQGVAFCYITDTGELVCEGLPTGDYTIERATDDQMKEMLSRMEQLTKDEVPPPPPPAPLEESPEPTFDPKTGVHCYVNADGVMVCEKLEPGDYVVKPLASETPSATEEKGDGVTFCYITDNGELICEGMEEGKYHIEKATDEDLSAMLKHVEKITGKAAKE